MDERGQEKVEKERLKGEREKRNVRICGQKDRNLPPFSA